MQHVDIVTRPDTAASPDQPATPAPAAGLGRVQAAARDLLAGLVVFLLGVPLAVGAALASGVGAVHGLVGAAVGGLVTGALGGAPLMVTGPVVALAVLALGITQRYGLAALCLATAGAGLLQLAFAALRLGRLALAVDAAILEGLLSSIGLQLVVAQLNAICGARPQPSLWQNLRGLPAALTHADPRDLAVAAATMAIVLIWNRLPAKRYAPGVLVATAAVATALALLGADTVRRVAMPDAGLGAVLPAFGTALTQPGAAWGIARAAVELALVCSVYSLLSALSVDRLHAGPRANLDRELMGQGAANLLSGLLGGLPVSGAVLRSSANIAAGATSRAAVLTQGGLMLLALTPLGLVLRWVPIACLAAFFVLLGLQLMRPARLALLRRRPALLAMWAAAVLGSLVGNLMVGVFCGLAINAALLGQALLRLSLKIEPQQGAWHVRLRGVASFVAVPRLVAALGSIPAGTTVEVDDGARFTDDAAAVAMARWREAHTAAGGIVRWQKA